MSTSPTATPLAARPWCHRAALFQRKCSALERESPQARVGGGLRNLHPARRFGALALFCLLSALVRCFPLWWFGALLCTLLSLLASPPPLLFIKKICILAGSKVVTPGASAAPAKSGVGARARLSTTPGQPSGTGGFDALVLALGCLANCVERDARVYEQLVGKELSTEAEGSGSEQGVSQQALSVMKGTAGGGGAASAAASSSSPPPLLESPCASPLRI